MPTKRIAVLIRDGSKNMGISRCRGREVHDKASASRDNCGCSQDVHGKGRSIKDISSEFGRELVKNTSTHLIGSNLSSGVGRNIDWIEAGVGEPKRAASINSV